MSVDFLFALCYNVSNISEAKGGGCAMKKTMHTTHVSAYAALCAGAAFCCAAASHTVILSVLGAIIVASIIICALLVLVILAGHLHTPLVRTVAA